MPNLHQKFVHVLDYLLPWFILPILLLYTYLELVHAPYLGFNFSPSTGRVQDVFVNPSTIDLQIGDVIVAVNSQSWQEARAELRTALLSHVSHGETLSLQIDRNGQSRQVEWSISGFNAAEAQNRFFNVWLLGYVFWFAGIAVTLHVRPRDTRSRLFTAFFLLTAVWLVAGNTSRWNLWESTIVFRMAIWLSVPIYLHLHWITPKPLMKLPAGFWWAAYGVALVVAICQWFELLDRRAYLLGLLVALGGSLVLLIAHYIWQPQERSRIRPVLVAFVFTLIPMLGLGIVAALGAIPRLGSTTLLVLPLIPGAYFYTIYRSQLGGLEFRANQLISLYLFCILLGSIIAVLFALISILPAGPSTYLLSGVFLSLLATLLGIYAFPRFQRLVDTRLLGIPLPPANLLDAYAARITTSLVQRDLVSLLQEEILPSLLIRQSTLLLNKEGQLIPIYSNDLIASDLPAYMDVLNHIETTNLYLPKAPGMAANMNNLGLGKFTWIRAGISIRLEERLIGIWLFGRRDPDDRYSFADVTLLQTLAHQTAIALVNIEQSQQLHALYHANIDRHEIERTRLAHLLHDDILGGLSRLHISLDATCRTEGYETAYQSVKQRALQMIIGLRPALLDYGLRAALEEFTDDVNERSGEISRVQLEIAPVAVQFPAKVEEYLFRIIQQACENALRHSQASTIRIYGHITADAVQLTVADNGIGFNTTEGLSLAHLLANKHFGLVGMHERAASIGATLAIKSIPGQGTQVSLDWSLHNYVADD